MRARRSQNKVKNKTKVNKKPTDYTDMNTNYYKTLNEWARTQRTIKYFERNK
jgi:hypothetical protein